jgi:ElaB/YqjD/DUF883 family membrane-anchored ribosome-binding protein
MKFTQNEAAKKISAILTRGGKKCYLSDRTINEQLDTLMKLLVNDDTELDDFVAQVEPMFKTSNGNAQNDQAAFIAQWNTDHPEPAKPAEPKPQSTDEPAAPANSELAELRKQIQQLMDAQAQSARAKTLSEKKNELIAKLKEKGVKDNEWIDSFVGEISITEDLDVEAKADAYLKLYNKGVAKTDPTPTPIPPRSGDTDLTDPLKLASQMAKQQREQNKLNNL